MNFIIVIVNLLYFYSVFCYKVINSFAKKEKKVIKIRFVAKKIVISH